MGHDDCFDTLCQDLAQGLWIHKVSGPVDIDEHRRCSDCEQGRRGVKASIGRGCNSRACVTPTERKANSKASVPFPTPTQISAPQYAANSFSKLSPSFPRMYQPLSRTRSTAGATISRVAAKWRFMSLIGIRTMLFPSVHDFSHVVHQRSTRLDLNAATSQFDLRPSRYIFAVRPGHFVSGLALFHQENADGNLLGRVRWLGI